MKKFYFAVFFAINLLLSAQTTMWSSFTDSVVTYSSPRAADLNGDGVKDIIIGAGKEGQQTNKGILALNGTNGALLWSFPARNEVFTSAQFKDITNDNVPDVFIGGRDAQFYAINGATGSVIWQFFPYNNLNPNDSGWYNFYSAQFIPDMNADGIQDLLVANGGDHAAPVWQTNRPPGHLLVLDAVNGNILADAITPDNAEIYCSPVVADIKGNGVLYVLFGTGGETLGGSMWAAELQSQLMQNDLSNAIPLVTHPTKGFIAPPSLAKMANDGTRDIFVQGYDGTVYRFYGGNFSMKWSRAFPGTESSAAPTIGNFTGNIKPDLFCVLYKGMAPSYSDFYQVMLDGSTGAVIFKDSIAQMHFVSANAFDSNGDGRDDVLISVNNNNGSFKHQLKLIDFQNNQMSDFTSNESGVNIGSTPFVGDVDGDNLVDVVYAYRADSINPMGWKGMYVKRRETNYLVPNLGIAWGSYMGTNYDGQYTSALMNCGSGSVISNLSVSNPTCNGLSNGFIIPNVSATATPPFTYLWSNGSVDSVLANLGAGTYSVTITDSSGCFETLSATLSDPYTISFGGLFPPTCPGGSNGQVTVSSSGCYCMFSGCTFSWSTGTTGYTASNLSAGTYSVVITHLSGCVVTATVAIPDGTPIINSSQVSNISCFGMNDGSISLNPTYPTYGQFGWSTGDTTSSITSLTPGNYSVAVTDARLCYDTLTFVITQPAAITLVMSQIPETSTGAQNGSASVSVSGGTAPYSFLWNDPLAQADSIANNLSTGMYTVQVLDTNGCSATDSVLVDISTFINQSLKDASISAYPNPLSENLALIIRGQIAHSKIILTDNNGKTVRSLCTQNETQVKIEREDLAHGIYFCKIISADGVSVIRVVWN